MYNSILIQCALRKHHKQGNTVDHNRSATGSQRQQQRDTVICRDVSLVERLLSHTQHLLPRQQDDSKKQNDGIFQSKFLRESDCHNV